MHASREKHRDGRAGRVAACTHARQRDGSDDARSGVAERKTIPLRSAARRLFAEMMEDALVDSPLVSTEASSFHEDNMAFENDFTHGQRDSGSPASGSFPRPPGSHESSSSSCSARLAWMDEVRDMLRPGRLDIGTMASTISTAGSPARTHLDYSNWKETDIRSPGSGNGNSDVLGVPRSPATCSAHRPLTPSSACGATSIAGGASAVHGQPLGTWFCGNEGRGYDNCGGANDNEADANICTRGVGINSAVSNAVPVAYAGYSGGSGGDGGDYTTCGGLHNVGSTGDGTANGGGGDVGQRSSGCGSGRLPPPHYRLASPCTFLATNGKRSDQAGSPGRRLARQLHLHQELELLQMEIQKLHEEQHLFEADRPLRRNDSRLKLQRLRMQQIEQRQTLLQLQLQKLLSPGPQQQQHQQQHSLSQLREIAMQLQSLRELVLSQMQQASVEAARRRQLAMVNLNGQGPSDESRSARFGTPPRSAGLQHAPWRPGGATAGLQMQPAAIPPTAASLLGSPLSASTTSFMRSPVECLSLSPPPVARRSHLAVGGNQSMALSSSGCWMPSEGTCEVLEWTPEPWVAARIYSGER
eukprot:TRINITY_DN8486_c0_g2_i1.p1 TRINITY_DN8486_c0_g2~~TRINITY_DN8486_c0_g2_i1.p1  ORF type:complete len:586 (+),score=116.95 TRINITY_DN8486_c0_g2_i1:136-1893(+)